MPNTYTAQSGVTLSRERFIEQYVAAFLASHAAVHYVDYCQRDLHEELRRGPAEDAIHLAECAWENIEEKKP